MMLDLQACIEAAYEQRDKITPQTVDPVIRQAVLQTIADLDSGSVRVAEKHGDDWRVNIWLKKAILLYFRVQNSVVMNGSFTHFFDKVPSKYANYDNEKFARDGVRVVPSAVVRQGAYIGPNTVLMPSFVNFGAYIGEGSMVDTWATVGSCAQIGKHVHLSGGVGIGGVLEPLQANPVIIEDNCFIGARSEIVEGMIVERGAVISMGVYLGQSTRIYDRQTDSVSYGRIPAGAVVVPGNLPADNGKYSLYCAVIVKTVDEKTRNKVGINALLRDWP